MTAQATAGRAKTSTNVREVFLEGLGLAVRGLGVVSPNLASAVLLKVFCSPQRLVKAGWGKVPAPDASAFEFEGERLAVYRFGPAHNGKTVLVVHGWNGRSEQFRTLIEPLRNEGFGVVAFDQAGHGKSTGRQANVPRFSRAIAAVAAHVGGLDSIVAHSLGSVASAHAIAQGLKVRRLVMVAPSGNPSLFIKNTLKDYRFSDSLGALMTQRLERQEAIVVNDFDRERLAPKLGAPLLVIHDTGDREVDFREGQAWAQAASQSRLIEMQGLGHNRILASPKTHEAIAEFLRA